MSSRILCASSPGAKSGFKRKPFFPSRTISEVPPTSVASTGIPNEHASMMLTGSPSELLVFTKQSTGVLA